MEKKNDWLKERKPLQKFLIKKKRILKFFLSTADALSSPLNSMPSLYLGIDQPIVKFTNHFEAS